MKRNNRIVRRWIIPILMLAVAAVICTAVLLGKEAPNGGAPTIHATEPPQPGQTEPKATSGAQTAPEEMGTAAESTGPASEQTPPAQDTPGTVTQPVQTEPVKLSGAEDLQCREFARFSGQYVEDGRDELVEHVASILVTNKSDQFLDLATMTYEVDGRNAVFVVTGLPAGRSAWVMESKRMVIPEDAAFTFLDCTTAFRDVAAVDPDAVAIYADANMLTAVNNTDQTLEDVFVYYKNLHTDGNFFGGITYRVDFGTLAPGESAQTLAGHYSGDDTEIVRIGWLGQ